jgi:hypothetical protein
MGSLRSLLRESGWEEREKTQWRPGIRYEDSIFVKDTKMLFHARLEMMYNTSHCLVLPRTIAIEIKNRDAIVRYTLIDDGNSMICGPDILGEIDYTEGVIRLDLTRAYVDQSDVVTTRYQYRDRI